MINFNDTTLTVDAAHGVHERLAQAGEVPSLIINCLGTGSTWIHSCMYFLPLYNHPLANSENDRGERG